jgi:hypothetical protein
MLGESGFIKPIETIVTDENLIDVLDSFKNEKEEVILNSSDAPEDFMHRNSQHKYLLKRYKRLYAFIDRHPNKDELLKSPEISNFYNSYFNIVIDSSIDRRKHP